MTSIESTTVVLETDHVYVRVSPLEVTPEDWDGGDAAACCVVGGAGGASAPTGKGTYTIWGTGATGGAMAASEDRVYLLRRRLPLPELRVDCRLGSVSALS
jgi:hypothetical protein